MNSIFLNFWNRSFRTQLIYGFGIIFTVLIVSFTFIITKYQSDFLHNDGIKEAKNRAKALATTSKVWVMSNDYAGLEEVVSNFSIYDDLIFAAIINMDGKVIGHTNKSLLGKFVSDEKRISFIKNINKNSEKDKILLQNKNYIDIIQVINYKNKNIGFVNIRLDQQIRQKNIENTILQGLYFTIISVLIGILFAYIVANGLIKKLVNLISTIKQVRDGNREIHADEDGVEEISELSREFNDMVSSLSSSEELNKKLQERLELAFIGTQDGLWDWNILDDSIYFSPIWKKMIGYSDDELPNHLSSWENRVHPDDLEKVLLDIQNHIDGITDSYKNIHRLKHKDGHWIWTLDRGKALFDDNGKAVRMVGTHTDITKERELQLKHSHQAQIIDQTVNPIILTDLDGKILSWNTGAERLYEYTLDDVTGKDISILYQHKNIIPYRDKIDLLIDNGEFNEDISALKKSHHVFSAAMSLSLLRDEKGEPISVVCYVQDITHRILAERNLRQQKDSLEYQANHDILTTLPNRLLFNDRLTQAIEKSKRHGNILAVFFIDLDRFKQINDSLGHSFGDRVLKVVATRLSGIIRKGDTLARLGGDEFTILMEELTKTEDASLLAKNILKSLVEPIRIDNHTVYVSSSIGISLYPQDDTDPTNLLKYADAAMYKAKDEGRDNVQFYSSEMTALASEHIELDNSLREALKNEEFVVYYQPQIDGLNNKIIGMEALVRWKHPKIGLIPPGKFIPLAEETGLIILIDMFVMKTAIKQIAQWYKMGLNPGVLALNLAMKQLKQDNFTSMLQEILIDAECKPEWIELEVTESQIMTNPENAIVILNQISDMGIELAVDDFGTGYSSLSYLKRLPIDKLKIDQSFIRDLPDDEEDIGITKAIISLARSLNLSVIAEGVETQEQKEFLVSSGCSNIQGYFYYRPMPADEVEIILREK